MATSNPTSIGGSDPSVLRQIQSQNATLQRKPGVSSPPSVGSAPAPAPTTGATLALAPVVSGAEVLYPQSTAAVNNNAVAITSSLTNDAGDVTTVYTSNGQITVNPINQTINYFTSVDSGVSQIIAGTGVTITATGNNGTGVVTINATGGGGGDYSNANVASYLPTYTGNVGAGNVNVTGTVYSNGVSATGLASLTTLNVSTTANLGAVGNVIITGGSNGQVLTTNGSGNLSWTTVSGGGGGGLPLANGNSNINIATANGPVTLTSAGQTWTIGTDGSLTAPNNSNIYPAGNNFNAFAPAAGSMQFYTDGGNFNWSLDGYGVMNLPFASAMSNTALIYSAGNLRLDAGANNFMFTDTGTVIFPTMTVDLHNGGNQYAQTLQFGDDTQQAVITGPTPAANVNAQRLIIQGQRGNGTYGEGGDVYVWAGDADTNGGDIKIYAGDADNVSAGYGGYINLDGGSGYDGGGQISVTGGFSANGPGGTVNISAGQGGSDGGAVNINGGMTSTNQGGNIALTGGYGGNSGGEVRLTGGSAGIGIPGYGNIVLVSGASTWTFDNTGTLTVPQNIHGSGALQLQGLANGNTTINIGSGVGGDIDMVSNLGNINLYTANNQPWIFDQGGNLTAPGAINVGNMVIGTVPGDITADANTGVTFNVSGPDGGFAVGYLKEVGNANTSGGELAFNSETGNATYRISLSDDLGNGFATKIWRFDGTGTTTFPDNKIKTFRDNDLSIVTESLPTEPPTTIVISGADFVAVNLTYTKDGANSIWYPAGYIPGTDPYIEFTGGQYGIFVPGFGQALYVNTGTLNVPLTQWSINPPLGSVPPTGVYTYPNTYTQTWTFGTDGNLTLPGNTFAVNYANGTQVPLGGGGNTGNVTFDNQVVIGTGDEAGGGGLYLAPGTNSTANLQYLRVRGGDYPTHIHLDTGNNQYYDQYFGADSRYVKLEANGNVVINADDYAANSGTWTFTTDGNLVLAGGNSVIQSIANSSLDPTNPNVSTMVLTPDQGYSSQALVLDPTAPGHIHLRSPAYGSNIDDPVANLFLGGEQTAFEVTQGANNEARIHSNNYTWTFGNDGTLLLPRDAAGNTDPYLWITGGNAPSISSVDVSLAGPANFQIVSDYLNLSGYSGAKVAIKADNGEIATDANMVLTTNNANVGNEFSWTFATDGSLTLPGNLVAVSASPAPVISGFSSVSALQFTNGNSNVTINANSNTWTFDSTGNLIIPGTSGGVIKTVANGAIAIAAIDNGTDNPAQLLSINANGTPTTAISSYANQATIQANINGSIKTWAFTNTGNLTLPGNTIAINFANGSSAFGNLIQWITAPVANTSAGTAGQAAYDSGGNLYVCVATNTWAKFTGTTSW